MIAQDIMKKIKDWGQRIEVTIIAKDHADKLTCRQCCKLYWSRGKYDPGTCRECEYRNQHGYVPAGKFDWENVIR